MGQGQVHAVHHQQLQRRDGDGGAGRGLMMGAMLGGGMDGGFDFD